MKTAAFFQKYNIKILGQMMIANDIISIQDGVAYLQLSSIRWNFIRTLSILIDKNLEDLDRGIMESIYRMFQES